MDFLSEYPAIKYALVAALVVLAALLAYSALRPAKASNGQKALDAAGSPAPLELEATPGVQGPAREADLGEGNGEVPQAPASDDSAPVAPAKNSKRQKTPKVKRPSRKEHKDRTADGRTADRAAHPVVADSTYELDALTEPQTSPTQPEAESVANVEREQKNSSELLLDLDDDGVVEVDDPLHTADNSLATPQVEVPGGSAKPDDAQDNVHETPVVFDADAAAELLADLAYDEDEDEDTPFGPLPSSPRFDEAPPALTPEFLAPAELEVLPEASSGDLLASGDDADQGHTDDPQEAPHTEDGRWIYRPAGWSPTPEPSTDLAGESPTEPDAERAAEPLAQSPRTRPSLGLLFRRGHKSGPDRSPEPGLLAPVGTPADLFEDDRTGRTAPQDPDTAALEAELFSLPAAPVSTAGDEVADMVIATPAARSRYDLPEPLPVRTGF